MSEEELSQPIVEVTEQEYDDELARMAKEEDEMTEKARKAMEKFELLPVYNYGEKMMYVETLSRQAPYFYAGGGQGQEWP
eukprot:CAMPEP_0195138968 /NCGR_PEP_ID=MMETSP0448-20130528/158541_1 /TAXON_ID=66468 /ORGANISM="Heterocapsa triquestra, Strain CCMP 448" /LENGTH=79 /DNA_ID=CAMNT_0040177263 /DNA_START=9 /DNA_END=244 /DNA_ORIENTATION=+